MNTLEHVVIYDGSFYRRKAVTSRRRLIYVNWFNDTTGEFIGVVGRDEEADKLEEFFRYAK